MVSGDPNSLDLPRGKMTKGNLVQTNPRNLIIKNKKGLNSQKFSHLSRFLKHFLPTIRSAYCKVIIEPAVYSAKLFKILEARVEPHARARISILDCTAVLTSRLQLEPF